MTIWYDLIKLNKKMKNKKEEHHKYKAYSFRLHEETLRLLKLNKKDSSWNKFLFGLINKNNKKND